MRTLLTVARDASTQVKALQCVAFDGTPATTPGQKVLGIAHYDAETAERFAVDCKGAMEAESGGVFSIGDALTVDATSRLVKSTQATDFIFADALEASSAAGETPEVLAR